MSNAGNEGVGNIYGRMFVLCHRHKQSHILSASWEGGDCLCGSMIWCLRLPDMGGGEGFVLLLV